MQTATEHCKRKFTWFFNFHTINLQVLYLSLANYYCYVAENEIKTESVVVVINFCVTFIVTWGSKSFLSFKEPQTYFLKLLLFFPARERERINLLNIKVQYTPVTGKKV